MRKCKTSERNARHLRLQSEVKLPSEGLGRPAGKNISLSHKNTTKRKPLSKPSILEPNYKAECFHIVWKAVNSVVIHKKISTTVAVPEHKSC